MDSADVQALQDSLTESPQPTLPDLTDPSQGTPPDQLKPTEIVTITISALVAFIEYDARLEHVCIAVTELHAFVKCPNIPPSKSAMSKVYVPLYAAINKFERAQAFYAIHRDVIARDHGGLTTYMSTQRSTDEHESSGQNPGQMEVAIGFATNAFARVNDAMTLVVRDITSSLLGIHRVMVTALGKGGKALAAELGRHRFEHQLEAWRSSLTEYWTAGGGSVWDLPT